MNKKEFFCAIALIGLPLLTVIAVKAIDSYTVTKTVNKFLAYNAAHPDAPLQFSLNKS